MMKDKLTFSMLSSSSILKNARKDSLASSLINKNQDVNTEINGIVTMPPISNAKIKIATKDNT